DVGGNNLVIRCGPESRGTRAHSSDAHIYTVGRATTVRGIDCCAMTEVALRVAVSVKFRSAISTYGREILVALGDLSGRDHCGALDTRLTSDLPHNFDVFIRKGFEDASQRTAFLHRAASRYPKVFMPAIPDW